MHILITGSTGLLGNALAVAAPAEVDLFGIHLPNPHLTQSLPCASRIADIRDQEQIEDVFAWARPDVVIHTAALGSVDRAEENPSEAYAVNVMGTMMVGEAARREGARFIYVSSNAVFNGENPLYSEDDPVSPVNRYGQLKVEAEEWVRKSRLTYAIVRPILMYGWPLPGERGNLVTWCIGSLQRGQSIKVVDNVLSKPLYSGACAEAIWTIINQERTGLYHVAGADHLSLYQLTLLTAEVFGLDKALIEPVPDSYFSSKLAPRPRDTSFSTEKMERELGLQPVGVLDGLRLMKASSPGEISL
jgi:dTDP-4-dehydrorhamnose reductase